MSPTLTKEIEMPDFRIRAYRRQLVEVIVNAESEEYAYDEALNTDKHEWDVIETYDIDDFVGCTYIEPADAYDPQEWLED